MDINGKVEGGRAAGAVILGGLWGWSMEDLQLGVNIAAGLTLTLYTLCQTVVITPKVWATLASWYAAVLGWFQPKEADES